MKLKVIVSIIVIILMSTGCSKGQKAVLLDNAETRIHVTFDEQSKENIVENINKFNET